MELSQKNHQIRLFAMHRRSLSFSIRTLLALTGLSACLLGLASWDLRSYQEQARVEKGVKAKIEKLGGSCVEKQCGPKWLILIPPAFRPAMPETIVAALNLPAESTDPTYTDTVIELLNGLKHLERVSINEDSWTFSVGPHAGKHLIDAKKIGERFPGIHIFIMI